MMKNKLELKTRILREIFRIAPRKFKETNKDNKFLARKFKIPEQEVKDNLEFLFEMYLSYLYMFSSLPYLQSL